MMMNEKANTIKITTWNVNGISRKRIAIEQYIQANTIDVMCIQESKHGDSASLKISGYQAFDIPGVVIQRDNDAGTLPTRGLVTYVRKALAARIAPSPFIGHGCDTLAVDITDKRGEVLLRIINAYAKSDALDLQRLETYVGNHLTILTGDLNAIHDSLGKNKTRKANCNGRTLHHWLADTSITVTNTDSSFPTHIKGNKLDYTIILNDLQLAHNTGPVDELTSDHFAITTHIQLPSSMKEERQVRKRLCILPKHRERTRYHLQEWYDSYLAETPNPTAEELERDITLNTERIINEIRYKNGRLKKNQGRAAPARWYNRDDAVKRINKAYKKVKAAFLANPTPNNQTILQRMAKQAQDIKHAAKEKDWNNFIEGINHTTPLPEIVKKVNIISGKATKDPRHPDPTRKGNELINKWASASSHDELPLHVRSALRRRLKERQAAIQTALQGTGPADHIPFTESELRIALKPRKSTAPGLDGITYDVISLLASLRGNPILRLFNLIWATKKLPTPWKYAIIIPVPKPGKNGEMRPISLTSCICKVFERLLLSRLQYIINPHLSKNLFGFLPGKSTHHCIHRVKSNVHAKYTAFIDLKGAFDRANPTVLLAELAKYVQGKMLHLIKDYLSHRHASVFFEGVYSEWRPMELGTPQGGVLSPTLFNILINIIASMKTPGVLKTIYADDITFQARNEHQLQRTLDKFTKTCNSIGLVISPTKTRVLSARRRPINAFKIQGTPLITVTHHKYLGVSLGHYKYQTQALVQSCNGRLNILRRVAGGNIGAFVPSLRKLYIMMIRSVIDYHSSNIIDAKKSRTKKLESIQNSAIRIMLGCTTSARQECARAEVGLITAEARIKEIAALQIARSLDAQDDKFFKKVLTRPSTNKERNNRWLSAARNLFHDIGIDSFTHNDMRNTEMVAPWTIPQLHTLLPTPCQKKAKANTTDAELQQEFLSRISELPSDTVFAYTDGSVAADGHAGCGLVIREGHHLNQTDTVESFRVSDGVSSTQAELAAVAAATRILATSNISSSNVALITDSMSAIQSIVGGARKHWALVHTIYRHINAIVSSGQRTVHLVWCPSHCGINGNEKADKLASQGAINMHTALHLPRPLSHLKRLVRERESENYTTHIAACARETPSLRRYLDLTDGRPPDYVALGMDTRPLQTSYSRLRMGYRYLWEVIHTRNNEAEGRARPCGAITTRDGKVINTNCRLCDEENKHTYTHYVMDCVKLENFRNSGACDTHSMVKHYLDPSVFKQVKAAYPKFLQAR